jgi:hypothetical protein
VLLTAEDCLRLCETPAATADLAVGRALEQRHALHIDGKKAHLLQFLAENKPELASPEAYSTLEKVATAATKPIYGQLSNLLDKVFTAQGRNFYFDFSRPELAEDFDAYLKDKRKTGQPFFGTFRRTWSRASKVGFQGVFLEDLPAEPTAQPEPFTTYIPSKDIWDIRLSDDRIEYLILWQQLEAEQRFFCFDDQQCHKVLLREGVYSYLLQDLTTHGLGYVPACPVTTRQADTLRPVQRTSALADSLEVATIYLRDANQHEMMKAYHSYAKMWSYGLDCDYEAPADYLGCQVAQTCNAGYLVDGQGARHACPRCGGVGKIIPVGPNKTYIVKPAPQGETSVVDPGPAGYITPELDSAKYIGEQLVLNEAKIEKAVLGKSGLLDQQKQDTLGGKILDWGPAYDRFADVAMDAEACLTFLLETKARYRYGDAFRDSAVTLGRKWQVKSVNDLEAEYSAAKESGLDDALLYSYLEEIIYTRYAGDPMELERNLLKLELTPFPTQTVDEAKLNAVVGRDDLLLKTYINDFFNRFERENGSILDFASLLSHSEKVNRIQATFITYLDEKRKDPAFAGGTTGARLPADGAGRGFAAAAEPEGTGATGAA